MLPNMNLRDEYPPVDIMTEFVIWWIHDKSSEANVEGEESLSYSIVPHLHKRYIFGKLLTFYKLL
jgi:hypothetical protein